MPTARKTLLLLIIVAFSCAAQTPPVTHYDLKMEDLKYVYGPSSPVARVPRGGIIETNTVDVDGKALEVRSLKVPGSTPLTDRFYVEGAVPGDTMVLHFLNVKVDGNQV